MHTALNYPPLIILLSLLSTPPTCNSLDKDTFWLEEQSINNKKSDGVRHKVKINTTAYNHNFFDQKRILGYKDYCCQILSGPLAGNYIATIHQRKPTDYTDSSWSHFYTKPQKNKLSLRWNKIINHQLEAFNELKKSNFCYLNRTFYHVYLKEKDPYPLCKTIVYNPFESLKKENKYLLRSTKNSFVNTLPKASIILDHTYPSYYEKDIWIPCLTPYIQDIHTLDQGLLVQYFFSSNAYNSILVEPSISLKNKHLVISKWFRDSLPCQLVDQNLEHLVLTYWSTSYQARLFLGGSLVKEKNITEKKYQNTLYDMAKWDIVELIKSAIKLEDEKEYKATRCHQLTEHILEHFKIKKYTSMHNSLLSFESIAPQLEGKTVKEATSQLMPPVPQATWVIRLVGLVCLAIGLLYQRSNI